VPCNDRFFLAMNTNMMTPIAAMKSIPQMDGIIATKKSEFSKPGYVLELGGSEIGNGAVVLLTETTFWFMAIFVPRCSST